MYFCSPQLITGLAVWSARIHDILVKDTLVMDISVTDISVTGHFGN